MSWVISLGMLLAGGMSSWRTPINIQPVVAAQSSVQEPFFFPEFRASKFNGTLALPGDARSIGDNEWALRLTDNDFTDSQHTGAAWYTTKQPVNKSFHASFQFRLSEPMGPGDDGADGFAFVIQDSIATTGAIGATGCGLGYAGIQKSIAIEFDTYSDSCPANQDPSGDHIGIQLNGSAVHSSPYTLGTQQLAQDLAMERIYTATIHYEKNRLSIELDNQPVMSVSVNIAEKIGSDTAWVGFTAGTGSNRENHDILNWYFVADWGLRCADFNFTRNSYRFIGAPVGWLGREEIRNPFDGWGGWGNRPQP